MGDPFNNALYRLDADLSLRTMESGIDISNGIGWSPDNRVLYHTNSTPAIIYAYDFDLQSGEIANRRIFVDSSAETGVPDGLTVDSQGYIWSARWGGWRLDRYDPQGRLERSVRMPVEFPTSVIFGGADLDVLYVTSARVDVPTRIAHTARWTATCSACIRGCAACPSRCSPGETPCHCVFNVIANPAFGRRVKQARCVWLAFLRILPSWAQVASSISSSQLITSDGVKSDHTSLS